MTTNSSDAYRIYSDGVRANQVLRRPEARKLLEQAVAIDGTFAAAWFELADVTGGMDDRGAEAAAREKVVANIDRLSPRQRLEFEAREAMRAGKREDAIAILEKLVAQYPDQENAYIVLSNLYTDAGDATKGLDAMERGVKALPQSGALRNGSAYRLLDLGRYPEALRELETYAQLEPNEPNPLDSQAEVYLLMSQPKEARERYARVLKLDKTFGNAHLGRAWAFGLEGAFDEALAEVAQAQAIIVTAGQSTSDTELLTGVLYERAGRYREASAAFERALVVAEKFKDPMSKGMTLFASGLMQIERNNLSAALDAAKRIEEARPTMPRPP